MIDFVNHQAAQWALARITETQSPAPDPCVHRQAGVAEFPKRASSRVPAHEDPSPPAASPPPPVVGGKESVGAPRAFALGLEVIRIWNAAVRGSPVPAVQRLTQNQGSTTAAHECVIGLLREWNAWVDRAWDHDTQQPVLELHFSSRVYLLVRRPEGRA